MESERYTRELVHMCNVEFFERHMYFFSYPQSDLSMLSLYNANSMSPEVIRGSYTSKADCWSIGVLLYMLLSSQMPFYGKKRRHVVEKITQCKYEYHGRRWKKISPQARALVDSLLQVDPQERPTAEKALQHEWLAQRTQKHEDVSDVEVMDNVQATIQNFADYSKCEYR